MTTPGIPPPSSSTPGRRRRQLSIDAPARRISLILLSLIVGLLRTHSFSIGSTVATSRARPFRQIRFVLFGEAETQDDANGDFTSREENDSEVESIMELPSMTMEELLLPSKDCKVDQMGPTAMAYIGDVVYELFVRSRHVWPSRKTSQLQQDVVALVRAEHQSKLLALMLETFPLTKKEEQILGRGRNAASATRNRQDPKAYRDATALEALIGYLYLSDRKRCELLLNWMYVHLQKV